MTMNDRDIARQALIEREMLTHIEAALRVALSWETGGADFSRKLSTLRFVGHSFGRHLDRLRSLDEYEGYQELIRDKKPHLAATVEDLRRERDQSQEKLDRILFGLDRVAPSEGAKFDRLCEDLQALLEALKVHNAKVADLLQEAFVQEEGGSG
jgi:hypothetical protein